ncbi:MAG: hypothetical protein GY953_39295 [bacterium]|nr:hypothetical protein [bacterium]
MVKVLGLEGIPQAGQVSAPGAIRVNAGAAGVGITKGLQGLANVGLNIAVKQEQETRKQNEAMFSANVRNDVYLKGEDLLNKMKKEADPGAPGFAANYDKAFKRMRAETYNEHLGTAGNVSANAGKWVQTNTDTMGIRFLTKAKGFEDYERTKFIVGSIDTNLQKLAVGVTKGGSLIDALAMSESILAEHDVHLTPDQKRKLKKTSGRTLSFARFNHLLQKNPYQAGKWLSGTPDKAKIDLWGWDQKDIAKAGRSVEAGVKRARAKARRIRRQELNQRIHIFEDNVLAGRVDPKGVDDAMKSGQFILPPSKWRRWRKAAEKVEARRLKSQALIIRGEDALSGVRTLDPGSSSDRKAADLTYRTTVLPVVTGGTKPAPAPIGLGVDPTADTFAAPSKSLLSPTQRAIVTGGDVPSAGELLDTGPQPAAKIDPIALKARFVQRTGMIPDTLKGEFRAAYFSGDKKKIAEMADLFQRLSVSNPRSLEQLPGNVRKFNSQISTLIRNGAKPDEARGATIALQKLDPTIRKARREEWKDDKHGEANLKFLREKSADGVFTKDVTVSTEYYSMFDKIQKDAYERMGNLEASQDWAFQQMKGKWGVTTIGGVKRWSYLPPEKVLGVPGLGDDENAKWLKEDMLKLVMDSGLHKSILDLKPSAKLENLRKLKGAGAAKRLAAEEKRFRESVAERLVLIVHPRRTGNPAPGERAKYLLGYRDEFGMPREFKDGNGNVAWFTARYKDSAAFRRSVEKNRRAVAKARKDREALKKAGQAPLVLN